MVVTREKRTETAQGGAIGKSRWSGPVPFDDLPLTARALVRLGWELGSERARRIQAEADKTQIQAELTALQAYVKGLPFTDGETRR